MRSQNQYTANCVDCRELVEPFQGRLYKHHGANMRVNGRNLKMRRGAKFAFVVRCEDCYVKHDKPQSETVESSGITYTGYGQNTHAICGN